MRALLVCAAGVHGSASLVTALAQGAELVVAVDGGGAICRRAGVVPDLVVGDLDSLSPRDEKALEAAGSEIVRFPAEKNDSDLALALRVARERGAAEVIVTAASSGRLDHTLFVISALAESADLSPVLVEPTLELFVLSPRHRASLQVRGDGATLSLIAFGESAKVSASGTQWPLDGEVLEPTTTRGLSNRVTGVDGAQVSVLEGIVLAVVTDAPHTFEGNPD